MNPRETLLSFDRYRAERALRFEGVIVGGAGPQEMSGVKESYFAWPDGRDAAGFHLSEGHFAPLLREPDGFFASPLLGVALRLVPAALRPYATT